MANADSCHTWRHRLARAHGHVRIAKLSSLRLSLCTICGLSAADLAAEPLVFNIPNLSPTPDVVDVPKQPRKYRVQISVDSDFFTSDSALEYLAAASDDLPKKIVTVQSDENLHEVVLKEYAIGSSNKSLRDALTQKIKRINGIRSDGELPVGRIAVPLFPANPKPLEAQYNRPASNYRSVDSIRTANGKVYENALIEEFVSGPRRETVEFTNNLVELTVDQARLLIAVAPPGTEIVDRDGETTIRLGQAEGNGQPVNPNPELKADLESALQEINSRSSGRKGLVLIHDSGWPSLPERQASYTRWFGIFDTIWTKLGTTSPYSRTIPTGPLGDLSDPHCITIRDSLVDFQKLAPKSVEVLYLPLTNEQNAGELLTEILHLSEILGGLRTRIDRLAYPVELDKIKATGEKAKELLGYVPKRWVTREVKTEKALILAPLYVLDAYARLTPGFRFFVNHSWTVENFAVSSALPELKAGMLIAAAGNNNYDVYLKEVQFASRCFNHNDVICVSNYAWRGPRHEKSSFVADHGTPLSRIGYVAFDGNVGAENGTSFSSPRVAWLLAAADTIRTPLPSNENWPDWVKQMAIASRRGQDSDSDFLVPTKLIANVLAPRLYVP